MLYLNSNRNEVELAENHVFSRYLRFDPKKDEIISTGIVKSTSIQNTRSDRNSVFRTIETINGDLLLISNLDDAQYICYGKCFCSEEEEDESNYDYFNSRRFVPSTISSSRTLTYLVAAVSSVVAYNYAKDHFSEECETSLRDICITDNNNVIMSEIDECVNIKNKLEKEIERVKEQLDEIEDGEEKDNIIEVIKTAEKEIVNLKNTIRIDKNSELKKYDCVGSCLPFKAIFDDGDTRLKILMEIGEKYGCEKIELNEHIEVTVPKKEFLAEYLAENFGNFPDENYLSDKNSNNEEKKKKIKKQHVFEGITQTEFAEIIFKLRYLQPVCLENSVAKPEKYKLYFPKDVEFQSAPSCLGYYQSYQGFDNPNVKCIEKIQQI